MHTKAFKLHDSAKRKMFLCTWLLSKSPELWNIHQMMLHLHLSYISYSIATPKKIEASICLSTICLQDVATFSECFCGENIILHYFTLIFHIFTSFLSILRQAACNDMVYEKEHGKRPPPPVGSWASVCVCVMLGNSDRFKCVYIDMA